MTGKTISHYQIGEKLGEGGMGVVYKAEDLNLNRAVALKFLRADTLGDQHLRSRFWKEAESAAALDHPSIPTVYEISQVDGQTFIAMAFIEGESLAEKIKQRPLPLNEALGIAIQVGEALQVAHERGIVHRDIKPGNVMITPDGRVKVMDFGLAHLTGQTRITRTGTIMGTPAYMSPEQAQGQPADVRSDIWALGVVLYEAITGQLPFTGENDQSVLFAILNVEPEPVTARRTGLPMELDRILAKALCKSPDARYQNTADLLVDLRSVSGTLKASQTIVPSERIAERGRRKWFPWAVAAASLVVVTVFGWLLLSGEPQAKAVYRFTIDPPEGTVVRSFELSPDGSHLAFIAEEGRQASLWLRPLEEFSAELIPGTENADPLGTPFWSPDSRHIGFFADGKLKKVGIAGEPPVVLADAPSGRGGSWNENGMIVFAPLGGSAADILAVSDSGGDPRPVTNLSHGLRRSPSFLPDGNRFVFANRIGRPGADIEILVGSLEEPGSRVLTTQKSHATFFAPTSGSEGYLLVVQSGVLMAFPFDPVKARFTAETFPTVRNVEVDFVMGRGLFSASSAGVLAYSSGRVVLGNRELVWLDRQGRSVEVLASDKRYTHVRIAPDGTSAAIGHDDLASLKTQGRSRAMPLTVFRFEENSHFQPAPSVGGDLAFWSPEGAELVQAYLGSAYRITADGSSEPVRLPSFGRSTIIQDWSPNGQWFLVGNYAKGLSDFDLFSVPADSTNAEPYLESEFNERAARFSPNGRYVAYVSNETGTDEIFVRPFPGPGSKTRVSTSGGSAPRWRPDGKELFFKSPEGMLMVAPVDLRSAGFSSSIPEALFQLERVELATKVGMRAMFDVALGGNRFLVTRETESTVRSSPVHVVVNWDQELARLAEQHETNR